MLSQKTLAREFLKNFRVRHYAAYGVPLSDNPAGGPPDRKKDHQARASIMIRNLSILTRIFSRIPWPEWELNLLNISLLNMIQKRFWLFGSDKDTRTSWNRIKFSALRRHYIERCFTFHTVPLIIWDMPHKSKIIAFQSTGEGFFAGFENCSIPTLLFIMFRFQYTTTIIHFYDIWR